MVKYLIEKGADIHAGAGVSERAMRECEIVFMFAVLALKALEWRH